MMQRPESAVVEQHRAAAIRVAIAQAHATDCVLIAGKGHELYQLVSRHRIPFSDAEQATSALLARVRERGSRAC